MIGEVYWSDPDIAFSTDACLTGCGGLSDTEYFHVVFSQSVLNEFPHIHHLELLAIIIAVRLWSHAWTGRRLQVYCDNLPVVYALNSGRVKDHVLARGLNFNLMILCETLLIHRWRAYRAASEAKRYT